MPWRPPLFDRERLAVITTVALAVTALGCGSEAESSIEVVADAGTATSGVGSLAVQHECVSLAEGFGMTVTAEGVIDLAADKGRLVVQIREEVGSETRVGLEQEHVWDSDQTFVRVGDLGWQEGIDESGRVFVTSGVVPLDPADQLGFLSAASDSQEIGSAEIRGIETSGYGFELSTYELAESGNLSPDIMEEFESDPEIPISAKVWIDGDGLARRLELSFDLPGETAPDPAGTQSCATDYFDFGTEVGEVLPSPDEVAASERALIEAMTENDRLIYEVAGATATEATCLEEALSGTDLYFPEPTTREEVQSRLPIDDWLVDAADCAPEWRLRMIRDTMVDFLAGELPDPWVILSLPRG